MSKETCKACGERLHQLTADLAAYYREPRICTACRAAAERMLDIDGLANFRL